MIPQNQRSEAWKDWRRDKIGSTCAASIMGCGFKAIGELWEEKLGLRPPQEENAAMVKGVTLEEEAREAFEKETGLAVFPMVCVLKGYDWCVASLDGMTMEKDAAVEIKCPGLSSFSKMKKNGIPDYYIAQLQHQMLVTGLEEMYFYAYCVMDGMDPAQTFITKVFRDDAYIENLLDRELKFIKLLDDGWRLKTYYQDGMDTIKDDVYKILEENNENMLN